MPDDIKGSGMRRPLDLISMGRTIIDVYGDQVGVALEEVSTFSKYVGGCPANIAIGTARLGLRVGMITRVGDDQHGRFLKRKLEEEGVDTSHVVVDPVRQTALAFLAIRDKETFPLLHYRHDCADLAIQPDDYTEEYIGTARALLVTGSHLATAHARNNVGVAISRAKARGTRVIFDIDYRPVFWGLVGQSGGEARYVASRVATEATQMYMHDCDLIVGTEEEIHIAGGVTDTIAALKAIRDRSQAAIVLKRGPQGCTVFPGLIPDKVEDGVSGDGFRVEVLNVVGAGDGFLSGFLSGWLRDLPLPECCRRGNAAGALVVSRQGCSPASPTASELDWFLRHERIEPALHKDRELAYIHRSTTRRKRPRPVFALAIDHGAAFEGLPTIHGRTQSRLKLLAAEAALEMATDVPEMGIILDDDAGEDALLRIGSSLPWIGRKLEQSDRIPLCFKGAATAATLMSRWPRHHIAKCLVPESEPGACDLQHERLVELYAAASLYEIEVLIELTGGDSAGGAEKVAGRIRAIQECDVLPDWWKVRAFGRADEWEAIADAILQRNPFCRGVVLLGGGRDADDLVAAFDVAKRQSLVAGFAVGRTIFQDPAARWLAGEHDDLQFKAELSGRFRRLVASWNTAT